MADDQIFFTIQSRPQGDGGYRCQKIIHVPENRWVTTEETFIAYEANGNMALDVGSRRYIAFKAQPSGVWIFFAR